MSRRDRMPIFLWASPPHAHIVEEPPAQTPLEKLISSTQSEEYSGIALEVTNKEWQTRWNSLHPDSEESANENERRGRQVELWRLSDTFRKEEVNVTKLEEADGIIGLASEWLQLDSPNEEVRQDAELALRQELAYASYLNIATVILPPPRNRQYAADYARAVNACFHNIPPVLNPYLQLSIRIPLRDPRRFTADDRLELSGNVSGNSDDDVAEMWGMWDLIRTVCRYNTRLTVCLDITHPLPTNPSLLTRWNAEPIRYLYIPASAFVSNPGGWPVLPKVTQNFIRDMVKYYPGVILSGVDDGLHGTGGPIAYQKYIRHLEKTSPFVLALEDETSVETFASGYWDYLQAPLQPLMDNLQSATYEVFERDPVKYAQYEQAIYLALCDRPEDEEVVICVAGAGRGPLITRSLKAIYRSNQRARIYAVEKNPSAYVTLQEKREREWGDTVTLLFGDMRVIQVPEKADILVSELLGSFGDNELSPECLDGACRFLKDDGISIPVSYTAYLAPLSSSRLHVEASVTPHEIKNAETPYVVMFQSVNELGVEPQKCWEFHHPRKGATIDAQGKTSFVPTNMAKA
ncbi:methyltransferase protein [Tulasnella sp. 403]|nr:methyltransferase protein [Tulasnella sp. 403]